MYVLPKEVTKSRVETLNTFMKHCVSWDFDKIPVEKEKTVEFIKMF